MNRKIEDLLLNPRPGSKVAAAKQFGIDLTLTLRQLRLTPEERLDELQQEMEALEELSAEAQSVHTVFGSHRNDKN